MTLEFRESDHTYWFNGVYVPNITTIMKPLYDYSKVPPDILEAAAEYGKNVHKTIQLWLNDELDEDKLDENLVMPLEGFKSWFDKHWKEFGALLEVETPMINERLWFAGTPDLVFENAVVEIKTRQYKRVVDDVQLAAQALLVDGGRDRFVLYINTLGVTVMTATRHNYHAERIFRKLLDKQKQDKEIEILLEKWRDM